MQEDQVEADHFGHEDGRKERLPERSRNGRDVDPAEPGAQGGEEEACLDDGRQRHGEGQAADLERSYKGYAED